VPWHTIGAAFPC
jgi:hypothetical protein